MKALAGVVGPRTVCLVPACECHHVERNEGKRVRKDEIILVMHVQFPFAHGSEPCGSGKSYQVVKSAGRNSKRGTGRRASRGSTSRPTPLNLKTQIDLGHALEARGYGVCLLQAVATRYAVDG